MTNEDFTITRANFDAFTRADRLLRDHLEELARLTKDYPVECTFAEYRFIFQSRSDIEILISKIEAKLGKYQKSVPAPGSTVERH